ncbi:hypothetical protein JCM6882_009733 [Rhodosporidiobolus microsporus]
MWSRAREFVEATVAPYVPPSVATALSQLAPSPPPPAIDPFPPLPSELVLRIFSFTLPPPSYTHAHARAKRLKRLALLNKDAARWAVLELRTHVALGSLDAARWFVMTARKKGAAWAGAVRTVRLGKADLLEGEEQRRDAVDQMWRAEGSSRVMRDLLRLCENVEELWISGISGVVVDHFGEGKNLRKLYITETRIVPGVTPAPPSLILPHLNTLHLKSVIFTGPSLPSFLSPAVLPALRTLDYLSVHQSLVTPLVHPRAPPQGGPLLLGGGGGGGGPPGLASITASLAALSGPSAASAPPSSEADTLAAQHPILALSSQLTHLSLGPHATRTIPLSALTAGSLALHFPSLLSLSLPRILLGPGQLEPADFPPSLTAFRVAQEGYRPRHYPGLGRSELLGGRPHPAEATAEEAQLRFATECAINVFKRQAVDPTVGARGEGEPNRTRVLAVPRLSREYRDALANRTHDEIEDEPEGFDLRDEVSLDKRFLAAPSSPPSCAAADPSPFPAGGFPLVLIEEDQDLLERWPARDGAWDLGAERWRERVESAEEEGWEREVERSELRRRECERWREREREVGERLGRGMEVSSVELANSSSPSSISSRHGFPPLPVELLLHVLSFALPAPSYSNSATRVAYLSTLATFSADFAEWAKRHLRRDVALHSLGGARFFLRLVERRGPSWCSALRSLRLGDADIKPEEASEEERRGWKWRGEGRNEVVKELLARCTGLEELWICRFHRFDVRNLEGAKNLRKLYICHTRLFLLPLADERPATFRLPHLDTLHFDTVLFLSSSLNFLVHPGSLPALRTLDFLRVEYWSHRHSQRPQHPPLHDHPLLLLGPQLVALSLSSDLPFILPVSCLKNKGLARHFPRLKHLTLPHNLLLAPHGLHHADFPPSLTALRISPREWPAVNPPDASPAAGDAHYRLALARRAEESLFHVTDAGLQVFRRLAEPSRAVETNGVPHYALTVPRLGQEWRECLSTWRREGKNEEPAVAAARLVRAAALGDTAQMYQVAVEKTLWSAAGQRRKEVPCAASVKVLVVREDQELAEAEGRDGVWDLADERWRGRWAL